MISHVDDVGTVFRAGIVRRVTPYVTEPIDLTGATVTFLFHRPDGVVVEHEATVEDPPEDGIAAYTVPADFLDVSGRWEWQVRIATDDGEWSARVRDFMVYERLVATE